MVFAVIIHANDATNTVYFSNFYVDIGDESNTLLARRDIEQHILKQLALSRQFERDCANARARRLRDAPLDLGQSANSGGGGGGGGGGAYSAAAGEHHDARRRRALERRVDAAESGARVGMAEVSVEAADEDALAWFGSEQRSVYVVWRQSDATCVSLVCDDDDNRQLAVQWLASASKAIAALFARDAAKVFQKPDVLLSKPGDLHALIEAILPDGQLLFSNDALNQKLIEMSAEMMSGAAGH